MDIRRTHAAKSRFYSQWIDRTRCRHRHGSLQAWIGEHPSIFLVLVKNYSVWCKSSSIYLFHLVIKSACCNVCMPVIQSKQENPPRTGLHIFKFLKSSPWTSLHRCFLNSAMMRLQQSKDCKRFHHAHRLPGIVSLHKRTSDLVWSLAQKKSDEASRQANVHLLLSTSKQAIPMHPSKYNDACSDWLKLAPKPENLEDYCCHTLLPAKVTFSESSSTF